MPRGASRGPRKGSKGQGSKASLVNPIFLLHLALRLMCFVVERFVHIHVCRARPQLVCMLSPRWGGLTGPDTLTVKPYHPDSA